MSEELKNKILEKIKAGQAKMQPKWHFILRAMLMAAGLIIGALSVLYIFSFILFILRQNGAWFLPSFGFRGVGIFLVSLPCWLILFGVIFIILLEILVRRYSFAWRKPLLYSLLGIIAFVVVTGILVYKTSFHDALFYRAKLGNLPIAGPIYREFGMPKGKISHIGTISEMTDDGFKIETPRGETLTIFVTTTTSFPAGLDFQKDDRVMILGQRQDRLIIAEGILRIDDMPGMIRQRSPRQRTWLIPMLPMK